MNRSLSILAGLAIALLQPLCAFAGDEPRELSPLARQQHCDGCHAVRDMGIGPPFLAVASRYAPERELAAERLAQKIIHGGAGNWGTVPMIPNERISLEDARALARWILSLADAK